MKPAVKRDELERELARLAVLASSALERLDAMTREVSDIRAVMDELVATLDEAAQSPTERTREPEMAQVEVVFK